MSTLKLIDVQGFVGMLRRLFKSKDVFLREIVQNALEATYQMEFIEKEGKRKVVIESDERKRAIVIRDFGIGMSAEDLLEKLTTLFRSGWQATSENSLGIGQFGFGFYSVFLVADRVEVTSAFWKTPKENHTLIIDSRSGQFSVEVSEPAPTDRCTEVCIYLNQESSSLLADEIIRENLEQNFLYLPFQIVVNNRILGVPSRQGWIRGFSSPEVEIMEWFRKRYDWQELPLATFSFEGASSGLLAVCPRGVLAPPVEIFRSGIAIARMEVIPEPLNIFICGLVDCDSIALRPDRNSLVEDENLDLLKDELKAAIHKSLSDLNLRNPSIFLDILRAHRAPLVRSLVENRDLRRGIGARFPVKLYRSTDGRDETIEKIAGVRKRLVWIADAGREAVFADRACHLGQDPVVLEDQAEQELVEAICAEFQIECLSSAHAYLAEMRLRKSESPRAFNIFKCVATDGCEIVCASDEDGRFPLKVFSLQQKGVEFLKAGGFEALILNALIGHLRNLTAKEIVVLNSNHMLIKRFEAGDGAATEEEIRLAKIIYFFGKLACGSSATVSESVEVYNLLVD